MKKTILSLSVIIFLFSCNKLDKKPVRKPVIIKSDTGGKREFGALFKEVVNGKTRWYYLKETVVGIMVDGKPIIDSLTGKYKTDIASQRIDVKPENVIENFDLGIDSLLNVKDTPKTTNQ